jgi:hypothetical protein
MKKPRIHDEAEYSDIEQYVDQNREFLSRVLRHGDNEARSYALALLANGADDRDLEVIQEELNQMQTKKN